MSTRGRYLGSATGVLSFTMALVMEVPVMPPGLRMNTGGGPIAEHNIEYTIRTNVQHEAGGDHGS